MNLKQKAITGVKWTTLSTIIMALAQLLQISILARYLEIEAFGLLAIIMVIIGFSQTFVDLGMSSAIIHKQDVSVNQLSTLYWLNILSAIIVFGIIVLTAPYIASFYNNIELTNLIILTSVTIIIQAFGKQFFVLFEKKLQFNIIAKIDIFATIMGLTFAIFLAINNFGIYSLIYPLILTMSIKSILQIYFGLKYHRPKFYFNIYEVKEFIIFGLYQMGNGIVNYFNSQFDIIIIGKVFGSEILGLYSIIKQLVMRPAQIINPIVTRVAFPVMAKVQKDTDKLKEIYLKIINILSTINFQIYISMIILAPEIITIFLGNKWLHGIEIFQILSLYALFRSTGNPIGSLVLAKGKPQYEMFWNIGSFFIIPITLYVSSSYGILGVCWGWLILTISLMIPNWYFLVHKLCKAKFKEYFSQILIPLFISVSVGVIVYFIFHLFKTNLIFLDVLLVIVISSISTIILNFFFNENLFNIFLKK